MTDIIRLDAATLAGKIAAKELSSTEITQAFLDQIAATDERYGAFLHVAADAALSAAAAVDKALAAGERPPSPLAGVPLALKDVFTSLDMPTTCGSKILEGWRSPYDATVTARAAGGGYPDPGQDQYGRVRDGLVDGELRLRPDPQPVEHRPGAGRLRAAAVPPRWPRSRRRWPSGPTPAAPSASRPR